MMVSFMQTQTSWRACRLSACLVVCLDVPTIPVPIFNRLARQCSVFRLLPAEVFAGERV